MIRQEMIEHWQSFKNPLINDILINLEKLERNHFDPMRAEDEDAVAKLLDHCKTIKADGVDELKLITMLNQLPSAYMLYFIHKLQNENTDLIMKLINYAQKYRDEDTEVGCFFQRNMVFEKAQLLGRIFATARMEAVLNIIKHM